MILMKINLYYITHNMCIREMSRVRFDVIRVYEYFSSADLDILFHFGMELRIYLLLDVAELFRASTIYRKTGKI